MIISVDHGPVPVSAEHKGDLAFRQLLFGYFPLCRDGGICRVIIFHHGIKIIHLSVPLGVVGQIGSTRVESADEPVHIFLHLIDL